MNHYKLEDVFLKKIQLSQRDNFENFFLRLNQDLKQIDIKERGYTVNETPPKFTKGVSAISFFSGAGGLDIGTQLAGAKVISSVDFDKDSVATLRANRFFAHTEHLHADVSTLSAKNYADLLKKENPDKLILV